MGERIDREKRRAGEERGGEERERRLGRYGRWRGDERRKTKWIGVEVHVGI